MARVAGEDVREALLLGPREWLAVPQELVLTSALSVLTQSLPPPSLEDLAARISPRAVFLIYAERGQGGEELNPTYFDAAREPKSIWQVPGSGHTGGFSAQPQDYERRVVGFFDEALGVDRD